MGIDVSNFSELKPFLYSKIVFHPKLADSYTKKFVGVIIYSEDTGEYLYRRVEVDAPMRLKADQVCLDILNDIFSDFTNLEYLYRPTLGTGLQDYPNWLAAVAGEVRGTVRFTWPKDGLSLSLQDALDDLFEGMVMEASEGFPINPVNNIKEELDEGQQE